VTGGIAGNILYSKAELAGVMNIFGTCGTVTRATSSEGSTLNFNGGAAHTQVRKTRGGVLNTGPFTLDRVVHDLQTSFTCTANQQDRTTVQGVISSTPVI
jgi:hypothetical protein